MRIDFQRHGYVNGHQLLATSLDLDKRDQETVNRLSDVSGPIGPGESFSPYLTAYPLPSGKFVFARTWPDLDARRAGCVRTLSLIISSDHWARMESPASLLPLLTTIPSLRPESVYPVEFDSPRAVLPPIEDGITTGIVEAIFLEQRKPIVCFQETQAETIALRLVESLWPALRRQFAFCTYALQARTIGSKPFDLLFAPKSARSRYSDWPGRKLDRGSAPAPPSRRGWLSDLASAIFVSSTPDLRRADKLGVLASDRKGNPTAVRFAMLWRDLDARVQAEPSAALGMLDILAAADLPASEKARHAIELYSAAVNRILDMGSALAGMDLLRLLLTKLPATSRQYVVAAETAFVCEALVSREPEAAALVFDLIGSEEWKPLKLALGVASGLAKSRFRSRALHVLADAPLAASLAMLITSADFVTLTMSGEASESVWWQDIPKVIASATKLNMRSLMRDLISKVAVPAHAELVPPLLRSVAKDDLDQALIDLLSSPGGKLMEVQRAVADALPAERDRIRTILQDRYASEAAFDRLRVTSLDPHGRDLGWVFEQIGHEPERGFALLHGYLLRLPQEGLQRFISGHLDDTRSMLKLLLAPAEYGGQLSDAERFLLCAPRLLIGLEPNFLLVCEDLRPQAAQDIIAATFPLLVRETPDENWNATRKIIMSRSGASAVAGSKVGSLISAIVPDSSEGVAPKRQTMALVLVIDMQTNHPLAGTLVRNIKTLASKLASKTPNELGNGGIGAWAELLDRAIRQNVPEAVDAASISLGYAMRSGARAVAPLSRVAFPAVLGAADQPRSPFHYWSRWLSYDVDNAKEVREQVVSSYLTADWPAADLLLGSWNADEAPKIVKILMRSRRGADLLRKATAALKRKKTAPQRLVAMLEAARLSLR